MTSVLKTFNLEYGMHTLSRNKKKKKNMFFHKKIIFLLSGSEGVMYYERDLMVYELYIATISCVVAAIFFGIISAMLAIVNTGSNPVEAICHVPGEYNLFIIMISYNKERCQ